MREKSAKIDPSIHRLLLQLKLVLEDKQPLSSYSIKKLIRLSVLDYVAKTKKKYGLK